MHLDVAHVNSWTPVTRKVNFYRFLAHCGSGPCQNFSNTVHSLLSELWKNEGMVLVFIDIVQIDDSRFPKFFMTVYFQTSNPSNYFIFCVYHQTLNDFLFKYLTFISFIRLFRDTNHTHSLLCKENWKLESLLSLQRPVKP